MFKTILVALDTSELSARVMAAVAQLNLDPDAQVILSHVISPVESGFGVSADRPSLHPQMGTYRSIEQHLQRFQRQLPCDSEIEIVSGDPVEEILRLANIYRADLIVLGSRGLTGVERVVQGSVSSAVLADAPCSVLVVKSAET
ncbi:MAG TPA: universal stress protein [Thermosynechococcus sp. M3746_W2019_013]|uniref:universal stress protein n=1 Tax=Thermosynechococcus sp. M3746_W2019_013 TaxID=2747806 RepID=UPI0019ECFC23|nr:universal stress protein [Thermosynechococcus sp. M3746_W2019_013]HIK23793.1 universal stress protein [Thermosynechococcus sp. M3746_W2019_013]